MDIYKPNEYFSSENLKWVLQQPWLKDKNRNILLAILFGASSIALGRISYPFFRRHFYSLWIARDNELPMGLINSCNLCYLNALLQAMAANRSLVKSLRRSAAVKRDRLLCSLVALLEGLSCCSGYLKRHQLVEVLRNAHKILIEELSLSGKWIVHDQQDVHELFGFFMDLANNYEAGLSAVRASEGLRSVSRLLIGKSPVPATALANGSANTTSASLCHQEPLPILPLNLVNGGTKSVTLGTYHVPRVVPSFKHNLIATQIFCSRCSYRGDIKLVPESCLILFPKKSKDLHRKKKSGKSKAPYPPNLDSLLYSEFHAVERLAGINCPRCHMKAITVPTPMVNDPAPLVADKGAIKHLAEINCRNTCYLRRWIAHLPTSSLVLYLQRAVWTPQAYLAPDSDEFVLGYSAGGYVTKFQDHVDFPLTLDVAPYLCSGRTSKAVLKKLETVPMETATTNEPSVKADRPTEDKKKGNAPRLYVLRSVIVHQGNSFNAGHYVTYRCWRKGGRKEEHANADESTEWLLTSDRFVGRVPFSSVKACQAYMLFYERIPESAAPPSPINDSDDHDAMETSDGDDDDIVKPDSNDESLDIFEGYSRARLIRTLMSMACGAGEIN